MLSPGGMRASKLGCLAILALISSCGGAEDGALDTADVGGETRPELAGSEGSPASVDEPASEAIDRAMPRTIEDARLAGFAGARFVVVDTAERTIVIDTTTERAFGLEGHAVTETASGFDPWTHAGFSPNGITSRVVASDDGNTMLVKTDAGIQAVDLAHHGAVLAEWRGDPQSADLAPDGSMFAAATADGVHLVRVGDGARASFPRHGGDAPAVQWTTRAAYWSDARGVSIVERSSFDGLHIALASASLTASKDGATFVAARPGNGAELGVVEVWRLGDATPRSRIVSASVDQVTVGDEGKRVAWAETTGEYGASMFLHTLDVVSGVHARFSAHGHCAIAEERIVGFEAGGDLVTDAECSPGCPSLPSQAQLIAYDFATGKKLREWSGELIPPFNEELEDHTAKADALGAHLGLARDDQGMLPLVHAPKDATVLVATGKSLGLVAETTGTVRVELPSSAGFSAEDVHFSPDGATVVAVGAGGLAAWDATDGRRIWSWK